MRKSRSDKAKAVVACSGTCLTVFFVSQWSSQEIFSTVRWGAERTTGHPHTVRVGVESSRRLLTFRGRTWACALPVLLSRRHSRVKQEYSQRVNPCYLKNLQYITPNT